MLEQPRWAREAWFPLIAGMAWIWLGVSAGLAAFLLAVVPGVLLLSSGGAKLLWPGDLRITQFAALGGALGVVLGLPSMALLGIGSALLVMALSAASYLAAGVVSVRQETRVESVPPPIPSLGLAAKVAADEALLATMQASLPMPVGTDAVLIRREVEAAREFFLARGWLEKPAGYHRAPLPLDAPQIRRRSVRVRSGRVHFEQLSFESEYEPDGEEPGRDRWLGYAANRMAHAWVVRHADDQPRPWIVCIHGYQMGYPMIDLGAFDPGSFHRKLGLNMLVPVLPLHGARKKGRRSGDGFLSANAMDSIHAEAQAMWDIRRLLSWVRAQGAGAIGVYGLSLGGYTASLLSCLDDDLACVVAGIPATDFARLFWRHGPQLQIRYMEHRGVVHDEVSELLRVISPLVLEPRVPFEGRAIFGGVADRLVPPDQVRDLWEHWGQPRIVWYQGSHLTFPLDPRVRQLVESTLRDSGVACPLPPRREA
jgi:hypothetical protein